MPKKRPTPRPPTFAHHPACSNPGHEDDDDCTLDMWIGPNNGTFYVESINPSADCGLVARFALHAEILGPNDVDGLLVALAELTRRAEALRSRPNF